MLRIQEIGWTLWRTQKPLTLSVLILQFCSCLSHSWGFHKDVKHALL